MLLLDTHILLWSALASPRLSREASELIDDPANKPVFSVASIWEIAIKSSLGREDFQVNPSRLRMKLLENGYEELPITGRHVLTLNSLPDHHKDPFDRILIAQATAEVFMLITADPLVGAYTGPILKV